VRETPIPVTVKEVTVAGENSLTGSATADAKGKAISLAAIAIGSRRADNHSDRPGAHHRVQARSGQF